MGESSLFFLALEVCDASEQFDIHSFGSPIWQRTRRVADSFCKSPPRTSSLSISTPTLRF
jgi:hypothetical protein